MGDFTLPLCFKSDSSLTGSARAPLLGLSRISPSTVTVPVAWQWSFPKLNLHFNDIMVIIRNGDKSHNCTKALQLYLWCVGAIRKRVPSPAAPSLNWTVGWCSISHGLVVVARPVHFAAHSIHLVGIKLWLKIV